MKKEPLWKQWVIYAEYDLISAGILFHQRLYSTALYHLQQANEKLFKSVFLFFYLFSESETNKAKSFTVYPAKNPREYGHRILLGLVKDIPHLILGVDQTLKQAEDFIDNPRYYLNEVDISKFRNSRKELMEIKDRLETTRANTVKITHGSLYKDLTDEELSTALDFCFKSLNKALEEINTIPEQIDVKGDKDYVEEIAQFLRRIDPTLNPAEILEKVTTKTLSKVKIRVYRWVFAMIKLALILGPLLGLSVILDPLESQTKYPNSKQEITYDRNNPYVKRFYDIKSIVQQCLTVIKQVSRDGSKLIGVTQLD
ncbi:MAG: HEPN domain-containing protein [Thaumarchaeota archaeon]|nr:HEPN domain-containing protein [Nitrososphaerota archaeon]